MAKRGLKRGRVTLAAVPLVHDLRANTRATHGDVAPITVDDPHDAGAQIVVMRSLRDDPLGALHAAGQIDNVQYLAGRHWQKAYELAEIGGARAIDYSRAKVDGGGIPQPSVSDVQARAFDDLSRAGKTLGAYGSSIVHDVMAAHMTIKQCADRRMMTRDVEIRFLGRRFHECLNTLAVVFGYSTKPAFQQSSSQEGSK
jgi:hypothetical protein